MKIFWSNIPSGTSILFQCSPYVRITDVKVFPGDAGYYKIVANIQNQGVLPTNVTQHALLNRMAKTVKTTISLTRATLVMGKESVDLGHLPGNLVQTGRRRRQAPSAPPVKEVEWMVKATGGSAPTVVIKAISEKGGTHTKKITLKK